MKKTRKGYLNAIACLLLGFLLTPAVLFWVLPDKTFSDMENRKLQTLPALSLQTLSSGRFETQFENYVEDQFPLRDVWVTVKSVSDRFLGRTEANQVYLAQDGYLIRRFTPPNPFNYVRMVDALTRFSANHPDMKKTMLLAPSAMTMLEEKLPAFAEKGEESAYIDRLQNDLSQSGITFVDVRENLKRESKQLYYRTDHHWTTHAAYTAYLALAQSTGFPEHTAYTPTLLSDSFTGTLTASSGFRRGETDEMYIYTPDQPVPYVVTYPETQELNGRYPSLYWTDMLKERDHYSVFFRGNHPQVRIETGADSERTLMVLKDSYANCLLPFLIQDYRKIVIVDPRYYTGDLETLLVSEDIDEVLFLYNAATLASDTVLCEDLNSD